MAAQYAPARTILELADDVPPLKSHNVKMGLRKQASDSATHTKYCC